MALRKLEAMSEDNEYSVFITPEQKRALTLTIFPHSTNLKPKKKSSSILIGYDVANCP
jgi:sulfotransferase